MPFVFIHRTRASNLKSTYSSKVIVFDPTITSSYSQTFFPLLKIPKSLGTILNFVLKFHFLRSSGVLISEP